MGAPELRRGIELTDHGSWTAAAAPNHGGFLCLDPLSAEWLRAQYEAGGPISEEGLDSKESADLMASLRRAGFTTDSTIDDRRIRATRRGIEISGPGRWLAAGYRVGLRGAVHPVGTALLGLVGLAGGLALLWNRGSVGVPADISPALVIAALLLLEILATLVHEAAHALVLIHHGRNVRRVGFGFYWGAISFYVDAGEALLLKRENRARQSIAGPFADFVTAGISTLVALSIGGPAGSVLLMFATLTWVGIAMNLVPFLELDGYWFLADLLDRPQLRAEARHSAALWWSRMPGASVWLTTYWIVSGGFGIALLLIGCWGWWLVVGDLVRSLTGQGVVGLVLAAPLVLPMVATWVSLGVQAVAHSRSHR